ncbi:unnamed protein product [Enterobius vermicularis]|uniref:SAYSvFN domain-containing protein n=1 Tax=Enterobius vermicularis TaxID=51028 RepID=A0A158QA62_ENTVE|nr:unnamed protein product [Enterobius vermicularis]
MCFHEIINGNEPVAERLSSLAQNYDVVNLLKPPNSKVQILIPSLRKKAFSLVEEVPEEIKVEWKTIQKKSDGPSGKIRLCLFQGMTFLHLESLTLLVGIRTTLYVEREMSDAKRRTKQHVGVKDPRLDNRSGNCSRITKVRSTEASRSSFDSEVSQPSLKSTAGKMQKLQTTITPLGKEAFREAVELTVCADHEHSFYKEIITLRVHAVTYEALVIFMRLNYHRKTYSPFSAFVMQNENVDGRNITVVVVVILEYFRNKLYLRRKQRGNCKLRKENVQRKKKANIVMEDSQVNPGKTINFLVQSAPLLYSIARVRHLEKDYLTVLILILAAVQQARRHDSSMALYCRAIGKYPLASLTGRNEFNFFCLRAFYFWIISSSGCINRSVALAANITKFDMNRVEHRLAEFRARNFNGSQKPTSPSHSAASVVEQQCVRESFALSAFRRLFDLDVLDLLPFRLWLNFRDRYPRLCLYLTISIWGFGSVFFLFSTFFFIFLTLGRRHAGEMSAYSVFNPGCERISGTLTAEHCSDGQVQMLLDEF